MYFQNEMQNSAFASIAELGLHIFLKAKSTTRRSLVRLAWSRRFLDESLTKCMSSLVAYLSQSQEQEWSIKRQMFRMENGEIEIQSIYTCHDCLFKYVRRPNYQAAIWRLFLGNILVILRPTDNGWKREMYTGTG